MHNLQTLLFTQQNAVATITLNRPDSANGMNVALVEELKQVTQQVSQDDTIKAVILTANGKLFCAGGDLHSFASMGDDIAAAIKGLADVLHQSISAFATMNKPVIVAVNGMAAGAGFSLAMAGDIVLAAESAQFCMAYTGAGLSPDGGASYYLPRIIGLRRTQELMLTNRRVSAAEALQWGAISQVVADDVLQDAAREMANKLASGPTLAYSQVKKLLNTTFDNSLQQQMNIEAEGISQLSASADGREGINAFLEKRVPYFTGA